MNKVSRKASAQGSLDGLCGIYAIINACDQILGTPLKNDERVHLFCKLTSLLDDGRPIGDVIHDGIGFRKLGELIDVASRTLALTRRIRIERKVAWKTVDAPLDDFWETLATHLKVEGRASVILSIEGKHRHWTVVESITENRLNLADSDALSWLGKAHCDLEPGKTHQLLPTQTYLLTACELEGDG